MIASIIKLIKNVHFKNFSWVTFNQIVNIILGLLSSIFVVRYLGPSNYGLMSYWQSFLLILNPLMTFGVSNIIVRDLAMNEASTNKIISAGFYLQLILSTIIIIISLVFGVVLMDNKYHFLCFMAIMVSNVFLCFSTFQAYFQVTGKFRLIFMISVILGVIALSERVFLAYIKSDLLWFCLALISDGFFSSLICMVVYLKSQHKIKYDKQILLKMIAMIKESWPLVISSLGIMMQARLDLIIMNKYCTANDMGQYSLALKLIEFSNFVPVALAQILGPAVIKAKMVSDELFYSKLKNYYRVYMITFFIEGLGAILIGKYLILHIYGYAFAPAVIYFYWFVVRLLLANLGVAQNVYISLFSLFRFSAVNSFIGVIINIICLMIFIPHYGALGAILSMIISFGITVCLTGLVVDKMRINLVIMYKAMLTFYRFKIA